MIGNFPQAFSRIGPINVAWAITQAEERAVRPDPVPVARRAQPPAAST